MMVSQVSQASRTRPSDRNPFKPFTRGDVMKDIELYRLMKLVHDVRKLRINVSKMSFITESVSWIRMPRIYHDDD